MLKYSPDEVKEYFKISERDLCSWERQGLLVPQKTGFFSQGRPFYSEYQLNVIERLLEERNQFLAPAIA